MSRLVSEAESKSKQRAVGARQMWLRFVATIALVSACLLGARAQAVYHNPVIAGDFPDPTVLRVGRDYWAMVTTGGWSPHFTILRSPDLVDWRIVGAVFQQRPAWTKGDFWAPELSEDKGRFYLYYTARRNDGPHKKGTLCVAVATADAPAGPYTDHGPVVCQEIGSIDAFSLRDETGQRYLIWKEDGNDRNQPTPIWAQPLTEDGLKLTGKRKELIRNDAPWEGIAVEGPYVLRRHGWYYLFYSGNACCGRACHYALGVARARKLLGPWEKNPANPIIAANSAWQCPGHGDVVTTPDERDFMMYHAYRQRADAFETGREAVLDRIEWNDEGWPVVNGGRGPSSSAPAPLGRVDDNVAEFFAGFNETTLDPEWQWPMNSGQTVQSEPAHGGYLVLTPAAQSTDEWAGAVLGVRVTSGDYVATTALAASGLQMRGRAGLAAYSWRDAAVGIAAGAGQVYVWRREGKTQETLATVNAPAAASVFLRMAVSNGETYRFAVSANGRNWMQVGAPVNASYIEAAHVALTAANAPARFDWLRITAGNR